MTHSNIIPIAEGEGASHEDILRVAAEKHEYGASSYREARRANAYARKIALEVLALASAAPAVGQEPVAIKALEWGAPHGSGELKKAETVFGVYQTWTYHEADGKWFWALREIYGHQITSGEGLSEIAVRADAQGDHEQRVQKFLALYTHPAPDHRVDAVVELCGAASDFVPILERHLQIINPDGATEASEAFKMAKGRVDRLKAALAALHPAKED